MPNETYLKGKIKKHLEVRGWWVKYYSGHGYGAAGIPDLLGCVSGFFVAIEIKTETGKLSKLQQYTIEQIQIKGGGIAIVVYGWKDFLEKFNQVLKLIKEK